FIFVGIYWNNHHHMLHAVDRINGRILWANNHLLFWLSLTPFVTGWLGHNHFAAAPTAAYGVVQLCSAFAYWILQATILAEHGPHSWLAKAVGSGGKEKLSLSLYAAAIVLAFVNPWIAIAIYITVAAMWLIPDKRIESRLKAERAERV